MNILGISGSPRRHQTTDRLVQEVLSAVEGETEFISLAGRKISPCTACLACVKDNTCKIKDGMAELRPKILEADGLVFGAPNFFSNLNGLSHCFLERFCQFRHRADGRLLAGKPVAIVSTGTLQPEIPGEIIARILPYYQMEHVGTVSAQGAAACFTCGFGETCTIGAVRGMYGKGVRITPDLIPDLDQQPEACQEARLLGNKLAERLRRKRAAGPCPA